MAILSAQAGPAIWESILKRRSPTRYHREYAIIALEHFRKGGKVRELTKKINVVGSTFYYWQKTHPDFAKAMGEFKCIRSARMREVVGDAFKYCYDINRGKMSIIDESLVQKILRRKGLYEGIHKAKPKYIKLGVYELFVLQNELSDIAEPTGTHFPERVAGLLIFRSEKENHFEITHR